MGFAAAIESAIAQAMAGDERIVILGEDVRMLRRNLYARFGGQRVRDTPISESAFLGAAVSAAMAGLRPIVEVQMVDFIGVGADALLNHAAKLRAFSGGRWGAPLVVRASCSGGYGDGGQHQQSLWGWLAHIPGLSVVVPSTPADAGGLMLAAIEHPDPVIFLEHKLLSETWLEVVGTGGRGGLSFDVPKDGARGAVPRRWKPIPMGAAISRRAGEDLAMISLGVGVHRCLQAATRLEQDGVGARVLDLRSVSPLDRKSVCQAAAETGRALVVDEDYQEFGLSGEIAAALLEGGIQVTFRRVCTAGTIPYAFQREQETLPNVARILREARQLLTLCDGEQGGEGARDPGFGPARVE
jgi:pyruvate/2-oxoglutarate/acetoin dehydrogenase E1 component